MENIFHKVAQYHPLYYYSRYTVRINDFTPTASDLFPRMTAQGEKRATLTKQLKKGLSSLPECFSKIW